MPVDYDLYPPNWFDDIRPRIRARAGDCCEACGVPNYAVGYRDKKGKFIHWQEYENRLPVAYDLFTGEMRKVAPEEKKIEIILTVAHLNRDPENHQVSDDELQLLCQRCHFGYDEDANLEAKKYGKNFKKDQLTLELTFYGNHQENQRSIA